MSELSYTQKRDLVQQLEEVLDYDLEALYPEDSATETVDSWMPVYYNWIRAAWIEAGCPDPDEAMPDNNEYGQINIHSLMTLGLWEVAHSFASSAIWSSTTGYPNTHGEALENLRENYPEWVAQKTTV
jgi:hypothetical protein